MRLFGDVVVKTCLIILFSCLTSEENIQDRICGLQPIFRSNGDLRFAILVNECNSSSSSLSNSVVLMSAWICERFNVLNLFGNLRVGADIYKVCDVEEMIDPFINIAKTNGLGLGVIAWKTVPSKINALSNALHIQMTTVAKQWRSLVTVSVGLISALHWNDHLTIITDDPELLTIFYHEAKKKWICVKNVKSFSFRDTKVTNFTNPTILFGNGNQIQAMLRKISQQTLYNKLIVIPLDGTQFEGLPDGSYIVQPIYAEAQKIPKSPKIVPSPLLLDIAVPFINIAKNISTILHNQCNNTKKLLCLKNNFRVISFSEISNKEILRFLKIEPLYEKFNYNIYKSEYIDLQSQKSDDFMNTSLSSDASILQSFIKVGFYNIFNYSLILEEIVEENNYTSNESFIENCWTNHKLCIYECLNFKSTYSSDDEYLNYNIVLKQDPWILAVLSIASLGILFTLVILIFIFVRLCKKDIFEGNPVLSVLLLLTLTTMYASVVPFGLEVTFETEFRSSLSDYLCLARSLSVTLTYSCVFSLMLSRSIMLATVAYEAGFMSHITGHVQSLLCLFMVAVQGALSLQSVENCQDLLVSNSFIYALSYDILLLALLVCSCPFIYNSQRNYKEGCYFVIAILLIVVCWMGWVTAYILVSDRWKPTAVCSGLLGTASAILGAVFIPRTYLMTSAVVRDSLTSALPSLAFASSTSVMDLNYSNAQHVYDCVNIATINANIAVPPESVPQFNPNFYSDEPNLETTEINSNHSPCESPDKVTRF